MEWPADAENQTIHRTGIVVGVSFDDLSDGHERVARKSIQGQVPGILRNVADRWLLEPLELLEELEQPP